MNQVHARHSRRTPFGGTIALLLVFLAAGPATASLPQGPWLDLLELRADQAMEAGDYAEVMRVADLYRQAGGEPGIQLRAQEIVARARHAGNPGSAFVPLGRLIAEAGPEHDFYRSALMLYAELEWETPHPHYRAQGDRQVRGREQMTQEQKRLAPAQSPRQNAPQQAARNAQRAYADEVQSAVTRRWREPEGTRPSDRAVVLVNLDADTGRVLRFSVEKCIGGVDFCGTVQETMQRLKTLPRPPNAATVRDGIRIHFSGQQ